MNIAGREIGPSNPPYMVAELSCNHGGSIENAKQLIDAAKQSGADAVKLQTYSPADLTTPDNPLWSLYEKAQTPREWHQELFRYAKELRLTCFSTPFSVSAVAFLEGLNAPAYKIASPEIERTDLIDAVRKSGKPIIISTGMMRSDYPFSYDGRTIYLHCIAKYPSTIEEANLNVITWLRRNGCLAGLSDHTSGFETAIAATALGACMIEKHFKLDDDCIDAAYSLNPEQFSAMCKATRSIWQGMGDGVLRQTCKPRMAA